MVTRAVTKRKTQEKLGSMRPKCPRKSPKDKNTLQGRLDLQITVPSDQNPTSASMNIQTTISQTVSTAAMQPLTLQPDGAMQGTVAWSPPAGPVTTHSASWQPQLPPQQFGWPEQPNTVPPWPGTWNLAASTYSTQPMGHSAVPWMMTGLQQSNWQAAMPYQAQLHPRGVTTSAPISSPLQMMVLQQHQDGTNTTTTAQQQQPPPAGHLQQSTTTAIATQQSIQNIPPVMPGVIQQLQSTNMPSKHYNIISAHVPLTIKNKVWSYSYVDLGTLLESSTSPHEEEEYDLFLDKVSNKISFRPTTKHHTINMFAAWNRALRVLTKLLAIKWPHLCLQLVQYTHLINKQAGKFPFSQVYAYDKRFWHQISTDPSLPWNQIDNQLWSRELYGQHPTKDKVSTSAAENFCVCYDFNKGTCTRPQCKFPHRCSKCTRHGHPPTNWAKDNSAN